MDITLGTRTFALEDRLIKKINLLCDRVIQEHPKQDSTLGIDGKTGTGKTNLAVLVAGIVKQKTGRSISLFFSSQSALEFAQKTEKQLIILDEPSLDLLSRDWTSDISKNFLRLLNTMRRKRHFLIINFANFWLFPQHLIVDRLNGLIHLFVRGGKKYKGMYIRQKKLESLWNDYKIRNQRNFFKYKSFFLDYPYIMEDGTFESLDITVETQPHATYDDYERLKDLAIASINSTDKKKDKNLKKLMELRKRIGLFYVRALTEDKIGWVSELGIDGGTIRKWAKIDLNHIELQEEEQN